MKEQEDPKLSRVLQEWPVKGQLPPRFQDRVWQRIEAAESRAGSTLKFWPDWLAVLFARPVFATVAAALLVVIGMSAGFWRAEHDTARWDNQLAQRYVAAVDPYLNQP